MANKSGRNLILIFSLLAVILLASLTGCSFLGQTNNSGSYAYNEDIFVAWENDACVVSFTAMDTYMSLTAYGLGSEEPLIQVANMILELEEALSVTVEGSDLYMLNSGEEVEACEDTLSLLGRALEIAELTDGALDISIYPVVKLWGFTTAEYRVPAAAELAEALAYVDCSKIDFAANESTLCLPEGMEIDFGALAKGYAGDKACEILTAAGVKSAILSLGGNIVSIGAKPSGDLWKVAITDPSGSEDYLGSLSVSDVSVVTAGVYERNFTDEESGVTYCHIIAPATGYPVDNGLLSVTVVGADGTLCDGLSTALLVMGQEAALEFWHANEDLNIELILVNDQGQVIITEGLEPSFSLLNNAYDLSVEAR